MTELRQIVASLNNKQASAVESNSDRLLVLAGAGSGKTRVLVHRIARHVAVDGFAPNQVLALTFTNKAAKEMAERTGKLIGSKDSSQLFTGTFHSFCARLLFKNFALAGLNKNIQILEPSDQRALMAQILLGWEEDVIADKKKAAKNEGLTKDEIDSIVDGVKEHYSELKKLIRPILDVVDDLKNSLLGINQAMEAFIRSEKIGAGAANFAFSLYSAYEEYKEEHSMLDFNDLIIKVVNMLKANPDFAEAVQDRFKAILVDEYQDTNIAQEALLSLICGKDTMLTVVGDEDQLIYSWRGARIHNILTFEQRHQADIVVLDQNYRSTSNILDAANAVIKKNNERKGKNLWTESKSGELIDVHQFWNAFEEATFVADKVRAMIRIGIEPSDIAILYRNNSISSLLEKTLTQNNTQYILYGGVGFWGRVETKHVLAYLKWISFDNSQLAIKQVLSKAKVGYGDKTHVKLTKIANDGGLSLEEAILHFALKGSRTDNKRRLVDTIEFVRDVRQEFLERGLLAAVQMLVDKSGIKDYYKNVEKDHEVYLERYENIMSVVDLAKMFVNDSLEDGELQQNDLEAFITSADLQVKANEEKDVRKSVSLMTLHASKGLEYPIVFMVGADEGIFPSRANIENDDLEEERRLMYVGLTRGMNKVIVTHSKMRLQKPTMGLSQFIHDIPSHLKSYHKPKVVMHF